MAQILLMKSKHIPDVAQLHIDKLDKALISLLGHKFVCCLYQAIIDSNQAFAFVAVGGGRVLGFVSCAEDISTVYKLVLRKSFFKMLPIFLSKMLRVRNIKSAIETLLYPARCSDEFPSAELLSIVVDEQARGLGLGRKLVQACNNEFRKRGIYLYKTVVGKPFSSNTFYEHVGFKFVGSSLHHGDKDIHNVYVMELR